MFVLLDSTTKVAVKRVVLYYVGTDEFVIDKIVLSNRTIEVDASVRTEYSLLISPERPFRVWGRLAGEETQWYFFANPNVP